MTTEDWSDKLWYPPKGEVGTPWLPQPDDTDEKLNLANVNILFILFCVQTAFSAFGMLASLCDRSEQSDNKKKTGSSSTNLTGLILGVFGICAILYNCRQLLMVTVVGNFIIIIGAAIMLVLMVIAEMGGENKCAAIFVIVCSAIILGLSVAFQTAMLVFLFPFIQNQDD